MARKMLHAPAMAAALAMALMPALSARALDSDGAQPTTLEADDFELDLQSGVRVYRGNVVFSQGRLRLDCDELVTRHDADGEMNEGVCRGNPGRFRQRASGQAADAIGRAGVITLRRAENIVILEGRADIEMSGNRIQGGRIVYDFARDTVQVEKVQVGTGERPRLIIPPSRDEGNPPAAP